MGEADTGEMTRLAPEHGSVAHPSTSQESWIDRPEQEGSMEAGLNRLLQRRLSRRQFLSIGAAASAGLAASLPSHVWRTLTSTQHSCGRLQDIEHVVFFIQENRSFDHYFGSYRGVRGFWDARHRKQQNGRSVLYQPDPTNTSNPPVNYLLPFHLDTSRSNAACIHDIDHGWVSQHQSWNHGAMDGFVTSRLASDGSYAALTMGYYTRVDLQLYYALADTFTLCDHYYCSVLGPTDPNRLYTLSATIDPAGKNGGPLLETLSLDRQHYYGRFTWTTMPERLTQHGISWKVYSAPHSALLDNVLPYFKQHWHAPRTSPLFHNAFAPTFPNDFVKDALTANLPQVAWVLAPPIASEEPPSPPLWGENVLRTILQALTAKRSLWAKTALFVTYDENGGFFDHVPPPTAPPGTPDEWVTARPVTGMASLGVPPIYGPIGLGFRVPLLVISPFSRGGFVCSDRFDHTSLLRFLETRFGVEVPNLSDWRRSMVGDLTSAFTFAAPIERIPRLPSLARTEAKVLQECAASFAGEQPYPLPHPQHLPQQEPGRPRRPHRRCQR